MATLNYMTENAKTVEHLTEALSKAKRKIAKLRGKLGRARESLRGCRTEWSLPVVLSNEQTLPVPRLEIVWTTDANYPEQIADYRMVYRSWGSVLGVALGRITMAGYPGDLIREGNVRAPFRVNIDAEADALRLPAYCICGNVITCVRLP